MPQTPDLQLLFEDEHLAAFDKPQGMPLLPERGAVSLSDLVKARGGSYMGVHRLDREMSGVVLYAKSKASMDYLSGQFQAKTVARVYQALVLAYPIDDPRIVASIERQGALLPPEFTLDLAVGDDPSHPGRLKLLRKHQGRPAHTRVRVLESFGRFSWVECCPLTGKPHQVRLHLAAAGIPVLNDALYGDASVRLLLSDLKRHYKGLDDEKPLVSSLALHAAKIGFLHPATRVPMEVSAPLPQDLSIALKLLRKYPPARARRA